MNKTLTQRISDIIVDTWPAMRMSGDDDVNERMRELVVGEIAVSKRTSRCLPLDIAKVVNA